MRWLQRFLQAPTTHLIVVVIVNHVALNAARPAEPAAAPTGMACLLAGLRLRIAAASKHDVARKATLCNVDCVTWTTVSNSEQTRASSRHSSNRGRGRAELTQQLSLRTVSRAKRWMLPMDST